MQSLLCTLKNMLFLQTSFTKQVFNQNRCFRSIYISVSDRKLREIEFLFSFPSHFPPLQYLWDLLSIKCHMLSHKLTHTHTHNRELGLTGYLWRHIYWWSLWPTWTVSSRSECIRVGPLALHRVHPSSPLQETEEQEKLCMNKTLRYFSQFSDRSSLTTLQRTVCVVWMSGLLCCTIAHSAGMNY